MTWRYQPVYEVEPGEDGQTIYYLVEAYFDEAGKLKSWVEWGKAPVYDDMEGMSRDLVRMLCDGWKWKPVPLADLRVGMTFEGTGVDIEDMLAAMNRSRLMGSTVTTSPAIGSAALPDEPVADVVAREKTLADLRTALDAAGAPQCHAARDGECDWKDCPQTRDGEPAHSGRTCPLPWQPYGEES